MHFFITAAYKKQVLHETKGFQNTWEKKLIELKREIEKLTVLPGKFNTPFSAVGRTTRKNMKEVRGLAMQMFEWRIQAERTMTKPVWGRNRSRLSE